MDIKEKISEAAEKIKNDPQLLKTFQNDPVKVLESLTGLDLPEDQIEMLIKGIKAKLGADDIAEKLGALGKLF